MAVGELGERRVVATAVVGFAIVSAYRTRVGAARSASVTASRSVMSTMSMRTPKPPKVRCIWVRVEP